MDCGLCILIAIYQNHVNILSLIILCYKIADFIFKYFFPRMDDLNNDNLILCNRLNDFKIIYIQYIIIYL